MVEQHDPLDPDIVTVQQHILARQSSHPTATGEFSWLLSGITSGSQIISARIRRAGITNSFGATGEINVQGESVQKLDTLADQTLLRCLGYRGNILAVVSEENQAPVMVKEPDGDGKYVVIFDPLDGSSNIDVNASVGTIFSILTRDDTAPETEDPLVHILQPGFRQVAAGYIAYGSSTILVYTTGDGVHMFTLDPSIGAYVLCEENVRMPDSGKTYSVNEANLHQFPEKYRRYLDWVKSPDAGGYSARYIGTLVADFHRTLVRGGVFLYPPTAKAPNGKLRLLYEANPMAFLAEQAGGVANDGQHRILEKKPTELHQRTPLIIGSPSEVGKVMKFLE
jgi:fructose-1,6-bisphosphatase I